MSRLVASDLVVDGLNGSATYTFNSGTNIYDNIYVGQSSYGNLVQNGSSSFYGYARTSVSIGDRQGSVGVYDIAVASSSAFMSIGTPLLTVGNFGTGIFNQGANSLVYPDRLVIQNYLGQSGTYNLNGGTLRTNQISSGTIPGGSGFGAVSNSVLNLNGGVIEANNGSATFLQGLTATYVRNGGVTFGVSALSPNVSVTVAQPLLHSNQSGDNAVDGGLTKSGAHTLTLTGANTYTGPTALNAGVLNAGSATALGVGGTITFAGGTLQYSAASAGVDFSARFSSASNQAVSLDTNGYNVTLASSFGGGGGTLTKLGAGTLTLNAANTYSGATNLQAGTVLINNPRALGGSGTINFNGGTLRYGTADDSAYNAADLSPRISTADSQAYSIETGGHNIVYNGALTSSGGTLTKLGTGTLALNGKNSYTGSTTVSAGTLLLNNANTGRGAVFVDGTAAVLGGAGATLSAVTVHNGTLNPGGNGGAAGSAANVGTLSVGSLQLDTHSTLSLDVNSAATYDRLISAGNVVLGGSTLSLGINPNVSFAPGQTLELIHLTGGGLSGTFAGISNGGVYTVGDDTFRAVYTATDFQLVAVPEPTTGCLVAAGLVLGGVGIGRRRAK